MENEQLEPTGTGPGALTRMPTGAKVFFYLIICLLPLALIALLTAFQTIRHADSEARERLRVTAEESSGVVGSILANHVSQLSQTLFTLETDPSNAPSCSSLSGTFADSAGTRFKIMGRDGKLLCGTNFAVASTAILNPGQVEAAVTETGLVLQIGGKAGGVAAAYYPANVLGGWARPSGFVPNYGAALVKDGSRMSLRVMPGAGGTLDRRETIISDLDLDSVAFEMSMPGTPITSPLIVTTVLAVVMWIVAALIGWLVVDALLIRPLRRLQRSVGAYKPGEEIDPTSFGNLPAHEIRELGDTFRDITHTVALHEADLAEGLVRQTKLTREVHHRVKNNLQVISSLINFHARGAKSAEASEAYSSIQRRVDALAVVHRNHYAEMEENRGLEIRSVIGELAANIRATAPEASHGMGITLEIQPLLVNQDVATAVAFLITEIVELAINCAPSAQLRISIKDSEEPDRAILRVSSPALVEGPLLEGLLETRYGRVLGGLARQLRTKLHHDSLLGAYEASIAICGRP